MKILVLGSKGQLGRCLKDQLDNTQHNVVYTSREQIDVGDMQMTKDKILEINPDIVVNASAYTEVDKAEVEQKKAYLVNQHAVASIAHACNQIDCWLIHISSDYVFDGTSTVAYKEEDKTNPLGVYGNTKLNGEKAIKSSGCRYIIIRTSWIFSEHGNNFLKTMLRLSAHSNELRIVGDQIGCPTYAQDIALAIITIIKRLQSNKVSSSLYHYSGNFSCSWAEFSQTIFDVALKLKIIESKPNVVHITTQEFPTLAKRPAYSQLDSNKIKSTFGIEQSDFLAGIRLSLIAIKNS